MIIISMLMHCDTNIRVKWPIPFR